MGVFLLNKIAHDQNWSRILGHDLLGEFESIHNGHLQVGANDMGIDLRNQIQCDFPIPSRSDDFNLRGRRQNPLKNSQADSGIFYEEYSNGW